MFTGLVEELGRVKSLSKGTSSARLSISAKTVLEDIKIGDSIAVNGTCLTVVEFSDTWFTADVMPETVRMTVLGNLKPGDPVNLERTLRVGDRFGGHIVSGHIDGLGTIRSKETEENAILVTITAMPEVMRFIIPKGSIAIDGISLTVVDCSAEWFRVSLIPHTAKVTTIGLKRVGEQVNLETDIIGKYVEKLLGTANGKQTGSTKQGVSAEYLAQHGFL